MYIVYIQSYVYVTYITYLLICKATTICIQCIISQTYMLSTYITYIQYVYNYVRSYEAGQGKTSVAFQTQHVLMILDCFCCLFLYEKMCIAEEAAMVKYSGPARACSRQTPARTAIIVCMVVYDGVWWWCPGPNSPGLTESDLDRKRAPSRARFNGQIFQKMSYAPVTCKRVHPCFGSSH